MKLVRAEATPSPNSDKESEEPALLRRVSMDSIRMIFFGDLNNHSCDLNRKI